jgi:hypothetical protein
VRRNLDETPLALGVQPMTKLMVQLQHPVFDAVVETFRTAGIDEFYASELTGTSEVCLEWWGPDEDVGRLKAALGEALSRVPEASILVQRATVDAVLDIDSDAQSGPIG